MRQNRRFAPLDLNGDIVGHPTLLFSLSEEAQAFVSEIADEYNVRNLKTIDITAVSQESVDSLATALELCSGSKVLDLMCGE